MCYTIIVAIYNKIILVLILIMVLQLCFTSIAIIIQAKRQLRNARNARNYQQLLFKPYYKRRIEGDRSAGSKAYLTCTSGWTLMKGTPAVQTCVSENGALVWTPAGTCVYRKSA